MSEGSIFIKQSQLHKLLGVSQRMMVKLRKLPDFPRGRRVGPKTELFVRAEVIAWVDSLDNTVPGEAMEVK